MPDLNLANPLLATYMEQQSIWWVEFANLDGLRIDTYPFSDKDFMSKWRLRIAEEYPTYVVTNAKFAKHFEDWASAYRPDLHFRFTIVNDGSTDDSNKLGAIGDMHLVLTKYEINDDIIVIGGDNLFSNDLSEFGDYCREKNAPVTGVYDVGDLEAIKKYNAIEIDEDHRITYFEEKPKVPRSTLTGIALYYYPVTALPLIYEYIAEGNNPDQPGRLVQWLYARAPFYVWKAPGLWYDVGSIETLEEANRVFGRK
jgi:glucose-1-phosphate thymidylyltransferase